MSPAQEKAARRLPPLPARRYFTQGEVCALCGIKPHVLQGWEQAFAQLRDARRASRREVYWHHEVVLVRRIRELLLDLGLDAATVQTHLRLDALGVVEAALPAAELAAELSGTAPEHTALSPMPARDALPPQEPAPVTLNVQLPSSSDANWLALLADVKKDLEDLKKLLAD